MARITGMVNQLLAQRNAALGRMPAAQRAPGAAPTLRPPVLSSGVVPAFGRGQARPGALPPPARGQAALGTINQPRSQIQYKTPATPVTRGTPMTRAGQNVGQTGSSIRAMPRPVNTPRSASRGPWKGGARLNLTGSRVVPFNDRPARMRNRG